MPFRRLGTSVRGFRIMGSKRALASMLVTVCFVFGIYFAFFNHPPAAEMLEINLHKGADGDSNKLAPHFRHLHFRGDSAKSSSVRALNASDNSDQNEKKRQDERISKLTKHVNAELESEDPFDVDNSVESKKSGAHQSDETGVEMHQEQNLVSKEQNDMQSGQNAKEDKVLETDGGEDDENKNSIDFNKNIGRSKEYGAHHIRIFDWENWVKANGYIDIGTIWAYCDDSETPPPVGKVMMTEDKEYGSGVKIIIHMNTTFEENIEYGWISLSVDVNGIHFFSKKYDSCEMVKESDFFKCPMLAGDKFFHIEQHVPMFLPTGDYYVESQLIDQFERTIVCAQVKMTL